MKKLIFSIIFFTGALQAFAQDNYFYLSWNYQTPLSNRDWLNEGASAGGAVGYRGFLHSLERLSIGVEFNWTTFTQYAPTETIPLNNGALTTDYYKYIYSYGAVVGAQYYFPVGESRVVFPYAGLGLGANRNAYTLYYNIYSDEEVGWGFLARPEAGIVLRFSERRSLGAIAAVHYDFSTNKNAEYGYKNFTSAGVKLGVVLMNR